MPNVFGHAYPIVIDIESDDLSAKHDTKTRVYLVGCYDLVKNEKHVFTNLADAVSYINDNVDATWVVHNASFDIPALRLRGAKITHNYFCTMVASHTWSPKSTDENSLDNLTGMKVDLRQELERLIPDELKGKPKGYEYRTYGLSSAVDAVFRRYLIGDLEACGSLYRQLEANFSTDERALRCLLNVNMPYTELIIELEQGTWVDTDRIDEVELRLTSLKDEAWQELTTYVRHNPMAVKAYKNGYKKRHGVTTYDHCPLEDFNPASGDQVAKILIDKYGWEPTKLSDKTGKPCVSSEVLEELNYPLVSALLKYQKANKLLQFIPQVRDNLDGNILRPSYNQNATRTTRLSSSSPNIQQIPSRDENGKELRSLFSAPDGWSLVVGDQSGFQLRIAAWYMQYYYGEPRLADVFVKGEDVHQFFADIYGCPRKIAKNVTFGYMFGAGATKMAATASRGGNVVPVKVIQDALSSLQDRLPALPNLKDFVVEHARENGGVIHDWLGQRYVIPELFSKDKGERAAGERKCFNYIVQGFEATAFRYLQLKAVPAVRKYGAKLVLAVHDEVGYICKDEHAHDLAHELTNLYTTRELYPTDDTTEMYLDCEFNVGKTWLESK